MKHFLTIFYGICIVFIVEIFMPETWENHPVRFGLIIFMISYLLGRLAAALDKYLDD